MVKILKIVLSKSLVGPLNKKKNLDVTVGVTNTKKKKKNLGFTVGVTNTKLDTSYLLLVLQVHS